jgi:ubiquinol-cytochrome c reductase cytochrome b subunit
MTFHYVADTAYAFESIEIFMRETQYGYFIRYGHSNGASFFFTVVYIHMGKAFFQASYVYPRQSV